MPKHEKHNERVAAPHTPTPWEFDQLALPSSDIVGYVRAPENAMRLQYAICVMQAGPFSKETTAANGLFIVDAVNNHSRYKAALEAIANIAGNLTDEAVEAVGGVNDGKSRALMVVAARQIAKNALSKGEWVKTDHVQRSPALAVPNRNKSICIPRHRCIANRASGFAVPVPISEKLSDGSFSALSPLLAKLIDTPRSA